VREASVVRQRRTMMWYVLGVKIWMHQDV